MSCALVVQVVVAAEGNVEGNFAVAAEDLELDGVTWSVFADETGNGTVLADFDAVDGGDDVLFPDASFGGGAARNDGGILGGAVNIGAGGDGQVVSGGDIRGDIDVIEAEIGAVGFALVDDILEHAFDAGNGDGETNAVSVGDGGVDADDFTGSVDKRAAGITGVDGGIGLDHVGKSLGGGIIAAGGGDGAAGGGDDAGGDGVLELAEGVADGNDLLAGGDGFGVAEGDGGEIGDVVDLEEGDVV